MAVISSATNEKIFAISKWLGLNEAPNGDTQLKMGESPVMRNFRVTRDGNLQKRPGSNCKWVGPEGRLTSAWSGTLGGKDIVLAAVCKTPNNKLYRVYYDGAWDSTNTPVGTVSGTAYNVQMFEFDGKVYIYDIGATTMYSYDGTTFAAVNPYIPVVRKELQPDGTGNSSEQVNKLTPKRRVWLSPDANGTRTFQLPEKNLYSIISAVLTSDHTTPVPFTSTTAADRTNGIIRFDSDPTQGVDTIEVTYAVSNPANFNPEPFSMRNSELYNGDQNNRIFLYGNNSNQAFYSGINGDTGKPDPTYFPDLNVVTVGEENEPITSMIRYNSRLLCFKSNSLYSIQSGQQMLADGTLIPAFYVTPIHRELGGYNAQLILNSPVVIFKGDVYSWHGNSYGNMTADERQARRISDRIQRTLSNMAVDCCYDDNYNQEYYISDYRNRVTLVWNYVQDVWYLYTNIGMTHPFSLGGKMYYFTAGQPTGVVTPTPNTSVQVLDTSCWFDKISTDDKQTIPCYWESGSMAFNAPHMRKYSAMLWVGMHPQSRTELYVTVKTDKISTLTEKVIDYGYILFDDIDFGHWTFNTVHRPVLKRLKIKAKKFVYYKLIFKTDTDNSTATVNVAEFRVRFTGYAK